MKFHLLLLGFLLGWNVYADIHPEVVLTTGHSDQVNDMVVSPDGRFLASAGNDKIIKIWEIATTQEYRTISGMDGRINQMIFAPDSRRLAGTTGHGEVLVWDVLTGEEIFRYDNGSSSMKGIAFSADGKQLYHSGVNGTLTITDIESKSMKDMGVVSVSMAVDSSNQIVYSYDQKGNIVYCSLESENVLKTVKLFDEFNFPFTRSDVTPDGRYLATGFNDDVLRIFDTQSGKFVYESDKFENKLIDLKFDPVSPYLYLSIADGGVIVFNYKKFKIRDNIKPSTFRTQSLTAHPDGDVIIMANHNTIKFYNVKKKKTFKTLEGKVSPIINMAHDPNGDFLAVASGKINIQVWDLKLNKTVATINGFFPCEFTPDGKYLLAQTASMGIGIWDVETGASIGELNTNYQLQKTLAVSKDGQYVAGGAMTGIITIWNIASRQKVKTISGHSGIITALDFHPTEAMIASSSYDQTSRIWDLKSGSEIKQFTDQKICVSDVRFNDDGELLASSAWDKTIKVRKVSDWSEMYTLKGHTNMISTIDFNRDGSLLVSGAANNAVDAYDNSVRFWDLTNGTESCKIQDHYNGVTKVIFDHTNGRAFSASNDGTIKINDPDKCEVVATYVAVGNEDFVVYTPDHYYMASRKALLGMAFRIDNQLVSFEQFDAYLNRPDIVAERIGKSPEQLINAYNYLYKKRLRKLKLNEDELKVDYHIPKLINETKLDLATTDKSVKIWVKAWDEIYAIKQLNVFVNDVPIFGENGYEIEDEVKSIRKQFEIPLVEGSNKIQLSCVNSNGAESLYETVDIIRQGDNEKHDLYIAAIGVSNYQDDRFNLTYPTKDATDIVSKLKESSGMYNAIHTKLLLDEDVTAKNFINLKAFFSNASHEDMAIIFIAGHGVLNSDFDYFYGTYDMDFNNPDVNGLAYEEIHALLNRLKPYKKLLIMDTCHSGELDKEEIEEGPEAEKVEGDIEFRAAGIAVRKKQGFGFENSVELMEDLFSDTRKGSGATVISSAGGAEYAMESDKWKNGLFTYSFLSGLEGWSADENKDGLIQVSEIRSYVHHMVEELSAGKQIPSSREENISQDYVIFGQ